MKSKRRQQQLEAKRKRKASTMDRPGLKSKYARKCRGDYPLNSPYRTAWAGRKPFGYKEKGEKERRGT